MSIDDWVTLAMIAITVRVLYTSGIPALISRYITKEKKHEETHE